MNLSKNSKFSGLSTEDQEKIIQLCDQEKYERVVEILARPRPEGLNLQTSTSALCRFYKSYHPVARRQFATHQLAEGIRVHFKATEQTYLGATIGLLQEQVFRSLSNGRSIQDILPTFRALQSLRRDYLTVRKHFGSSPDRAATAELAALAKDSPEPEFVPNEPEPPAPGAVGADPNSAEISTETPRNSALSTNSTTEIPAPSLPPVPPEHAEPSMHGATLLPPFIRAVNIVPLPQPLQRPSMPAMTSVSTASSMFTRFPAAGNCPEVTSCANSRKAATRSS